MSKQQEKCDTHKCQNEILDLNYHLGIHLIVFTLTHASSFEFSKTRGTQRRVTHISTRKVETNII